MTETTATRAQAAAAVVTEFFDRYRAHDVDGMTDLCSMNAGFSYVPVELWGKQRVLRGGSWGDDVPACLLSSFRRHELPDVRGVVFGFRVVLDENPPPEKKK